MGCNKLPLIHCTTSVLCEGQRVNYSPIFSAQHAPDSRTAAPQVTRHFGTPAQHNARSFGLIRKSVEYHTDPFELSRIWMCNGLNVRPSVHLRRPGQLSNL